MSRKTELLLFAVLAFSKTPVKMIEMLSSLRKLHLLAKKKSKTTALVVLYVCYIYVIMTTKLHQQSRN